MLLELGDWAVLEETQCSQINSELREDAECSSYKLPREGLCVDLVF